MRCHRATSRGDRFAQQVREPQPVVRDKPRVERCQLRQLVEDLRGRGELDEEVASRPSHTARRRQPLMVDSASTDGPKPLASNPPGAVWTIAWSHNVALLNKLDDHELRRWYASRAVQYGWSVAVLEHQIHTSLHTRTGAAPNNLEARLQGEGTDLARDVAKDPLVLDFLGHTEEVHEHAMEEAMTLRLAQTLAEFGPRFAFVGRQYHLDVGGDDFFVDLLLYHVPSDRYLVVELKAGKFKPEHLGQLNFMSRPLTTRSGCRGGPRPSGFWCVGPKCSHRPLCT